MSTEPLAVTPESTTFVPVAPPASDHDWGAPDATRFTYLPDEPPPDPAVSSARGTLLDHWGEGPPGADAVLGDLAAKAEAVTSLDKPAQLAALDALGEAQHAQADADIEKGEADVDQKADRQRTDLASEEAHNQSQLQAPALTPPERPSAAPTVCVADREQMKADVDSRSDAELAELETTFAEEKLALETKLEAQLTSLAGEQDTQVAGMATHLAGGNDTLAKDIGKRVGAHEEAMAKERPDLDAMADAFKPALGTQADDDAEKALADATTQAESTRKAAAANALTITTIATANASAARTLAAGKAAEATAAANARAEEIKKDPDAKISASISVVTDGITRALEAKKIGEEKAKEIEDKGAADAKAATDKGETDALAQLERGKQAAARAREQGKHAAGRVDGARGRTEADMKAKSSAAEARMDAERKQMDLAGQAGSSTAEASMSTGQVEARKKAEKEKADALAKLQASHEAAKTKIEAKRKANLDRIAGAKEKDLCRVQTVVDADLEVMERTSEDTKKQMDVQIKVAEQRVAAEVNRRKLAMRAEAAKAKAAIDRFVREAKGRIATADKGTAKEIKDAAAAGVAQIEAEGQNAYADLMKINAGDRATTNALAEADRTAALTAMSESIVDLAGKQASVTSDIDQKWLDDAVEVAQGKLDDSGVLNVVTDDEANRALNVIATLPPHLQGKAVESLGDDQFENLLDEVPEENRKHFATMVAETKDPERKLKLFREQHKSQVDADVKALEGDTGHWYSWDTAEQDENDRRHGKRKEAAAESKDEIDAETEYFLDKLEEGGTVTTADIDDVVSRKNREHALEMKYNTNLTNERGTRESGPRKGSQIVWEDEELKQLEGSFGQVPEAHMAGNKNLDEVRREDMNQDGFLWWKKDSPNTGGTHSGGTVTVYDNGAVNQDGYRHGGDARELASPHICGICGVKITRLDMVLTHEIGHDVHDQEDEVFEKFQKTAGWESQDEGDLEDAGLTEADIEALEKTREDNYSGRTTITKNGKIYMVDPYGGGFLVVDETAMPASGEAVTGVANDTWGYARSNYKDHFAEMYAKAVHVPKKLHEDLVGRHTVAVATATSDVTNQEALIKSMAASGQDTSAAEAQLAELKAAQSKAVAAQTQQGEMYRIMREDVFHTDKAVSAARQRLVDSGAPQAKLDQFDKDAAQAATPQQVETIESQIGHGP
jgi:hypothetical protein